MEEEKRIEEQVLLWYSGIVDHWCGDGLCVTVLQALFNVFSFFTSEIQCPGLLPCQGVSYLYSVSRSVYKAPKDELGYYHHRCRCRCAQLPLVGFGLFILFVYAYDDDLLIYWSPSVYLVNHPGIDRWARL